MHDHAIECKYLCGTAHVWGQRGTSYVDSQLPASLRQSFSVVHYCRHQVSWLRSFWGLSCLCLSSPLRHTGITAMCYITEHLYRIWDSNLGLHACRASTLSTELFFPACNKYLLINVSTYTHNKSVVAKFKKLSLVKKSGVSNEPSWLIFNWF